MNSNLFVGALAVALAGCSSVSVEYTHLNPPPQGHQPTAGNQIEVFTSAPPPRAYVELGTMKGLHDSIASDEAMFMEMKNEAARRGCDALIVTQRDGPIAIASCVAYKVP